MIRNCLIALIAGLSIAYAATTEDEIRQVEKDWAVKVTSGNHAALDQILDAQLIYAHSTGVIENKSEYMARLRRGVQKYDKIEHQNLTVRIYGNSAIAHSKVRMTGTSDTRAFDDKLMMMHVWIKQAGKWQLVAHQTTKLP